MKKTEVINAEIVNTRPVSELTIEEWREQKKKQQEQAKAEREKYLARKKEELQYRADRDKELVKGVFYYHESPGGVLKFNKRTYPGEPITEWTFTDGEMREIPYGIALHLNQSGKYPKYEYITNELGRIIPGGNSKSRRIKEWVSRYSFRSLDFTGLELDDFSSKKIVIVE